MTHFPPPAVLEKRRKLVRTFGMAASALMVLTLLTVFVLIARDRAAHDEATCPYQPLTERPYSKGRVLEQSRSCTPEVSERRYLLEREGAAPLEIAVRRLPPAKFAPDRYRWEVSEDPEKGVVVQFHIDGQLSNEYREHDTGRP